MDGGIFSLARCVILFISKHENLVEDPSNDLSIDIIHMILDKRQGYTISNSNEAYD